MPATARSSAGSWARSWGASAKAKTVHTASRTRKWITFAIEGVKRAADVNRMADAATVEQIQQTEEVEPSEQGAGTAKRRPTPRPSPPKSFRGVSSPTAAMAVAALLPWLRRPECPVEVQR